MLKLLEFGMRNIDSTNPLLRIAARICLSLTQTWADYTERKVNRRWERRPDLDLPQERLEKIRREILREIRQRKKKR